MAKKVVLKDNNGNRCYPVTRDECILSGNKTLPEKFTELDKQYIFSNNSIRSNKLQKAGYFDSILGAAFNLDDFDKTKEYGLYIGQIFSDKPFIALYILEPLTSVINLKSADTGNLMLFKDDNQENFVLIDKSKLDTEANYSINSSSGVELNKKLFYNELYKKNLSLIKKNSELIKSIETNIGSLNEDIGSLNEDIGSLNVAIYGGSIQELEGNFFAGYPSINGSIGEYENNWCSKKYIIDSSLFDKVINVETSLNNNKYISLWSITDENKKVIAYGSTTDVSNTDYIDLSSLSLTKEQYYLYVAGLTAEPEKIIAKYQDVSSNSIVGRIENLESNKQLEDFFELLIGDEIYAVVDDTIQIYYDSIVNTNIKNFNIYSICEIGKSFKRYFEVTPSSSDIGEKELEIIVSRYKDADSADLSIITSKKIKLIVTDKVVASSEINILSVGDSTTFGGQWVREAQRRFSSSDGSPVGVGKTNVNFVGRLKLTVDEKEFGWEGTGGWNWDTYINPSRKSCRFVCENVSSLSIGAVYEDANGARFQIDEINITGSSGNIRCMYSYDTPSSNEPPASGTLSRIRGTGDETITYTSFTLENYSPFYNNETGKIDFISYVQKYCNSKVNILAVWLGVNSTMTSPAEDWVQNKIIKNAKIFIDEFHEQFPNAKVVLFTIPLPSPLGGLTTNYGASENGIVRRYQRKIQTINRAYYNLSKEESYSNFIIVNDNCAQFDSENGYPYIEKDVNNRMSSIKEIVQTNGVHPSNEGYYLVADSAYRTISYIINNL